MATLSFRDRFFSKRTAEAMMSPLGIVLFGAGTAVSVVAGLPIIAAAGVGVLAWGGRVLFGMPGAPTRERVEPETLSEPWRSYVTSAQDATRRFQRVVSSMPAGPLRTRLDQLAARLDDGTDESWRIARRGHEVVAAVGQIDTASAERQLAELTSQTEHGVASAAQAGTIAALEAQLASANRLAAVANSSQDRLRLLDARFDELVARAVEVSVGSGDSDLLGDEVDDLVTELESLRIALEETEHPATSLPPLPNPGDQPRQMPGSA